MKEEFKQDMRELFSRLREAHSVGLADKSTFDVGVHVLAIMAKSGCDEVCVTWEELYDGVVVDNKNGHVNSRAPDNQYTLYGALQELEERFGLVSHVDRASLDQHLAEGRQSREFYHFTREPGVQSDIIGERTRLLFKYEPWVGEGIMAAIQQWRAGVLRVLVLPRWLTSAPKLGI